MDIEENSPYQEGVFSGTYQRLDKSDFQEPQEFDSLIHTDKIVQKFLPKQADMDNILKIIQRKDLKGIHLPVTVKYIQAGYLVSPYFKHLYLYLAQKSCLHKESNLQSGNMDNILKIIQRKDLKGIHLPVTVKYIQAGYLVSPYFKHLYLYLAQKSCLHKESNLQSGNISRKIYIAKLIII